MTLPRLLLRLLPLLVVILIDSISYTIVVPILSAALLSDHPVLMATASEDTRYVVYGVAIGIFELMLLYMAPVLGEVSDRKGRRIVLLVCLAGAIASFVLIGAAILTNFVVLLLLGRMLGGATAGSQPVAQAAAVDVSTEDRKPLALSLALLASSLGFVAGPLLGGLMSWDDNVVVSDLVIPLVVTAVLAAAGIVLVLFGYRDSRPPVQGQGKVDLWMGVRGFRAAFADSAIRRLVFVFALMQMAWGAFFLFLPSLLYERFDVETSVVTLMLALLGVGFCLAYGLFLPWLSKHYSARSLTIWSLWATVVLMAAAVFWADLGVMWTVAIPVAATVSIAFGAILTQFSDAVDADRQGWILGISGSVNALAWAVSSVAAGFLSAISYVTPFIIAVLVLAVSAALATLPLKSRTAQLDT
ncbi:MFS family permease [Mycolicibacterium sp. BK556]|uniref:MFS transporter n=1 Tax=unclassified Mycolicibacterium TaxID=2636767 RepID=UPI00161080AB|nr:MULTISPECIES: MFS transporter [unclassified Mycolicibacterium]MBB3600444.1 MFS family permease [Mycolicibacterium sp. BK556]MBB3630196.1 MFS family permease [Mycolicibacterium sp. BK607]MBB3748195.1 MFS family permease [Mycolicibacterium sp. BK634]